MRTGFGARSASAAALVLQIDGKLVAAGSSSADGRSFNFALARYNPDGSLDPSFGAGGQILTDLGKSDRAYALALQPDGKIVAAGVSSETTQSGDFALVRYNPDGSLDTGFGSGGRGGRDSCKPNPGSKRCETQSTTRPRDPPDPTPPPCSPVTNVPCVQ